MSISRTYQVEELMRGVERPVSPIQRRPLRAIAEMLIEAWEGLLESYPEVMRNHEEKEVNALMESRLKGLSENNPQWRMLVVNVDRGKETINYDGSMLETRPDLSIYLTRRSSKLPLLVECKILDKSKKKTIELYCVEGMSRFIKGQYAWYASEAFILAYVRDSSTIPKNLTPHLVVHQGKSPDPFMTEQLPTDLNHRSQTLALSRHGRNFTDAPGAIDLWHLWLT